MTGTDTPVGRRRPVRAVLLIATAQFALAAAALVTAPAAFGHGSRDRATAAPPPDRAVLAEVEHAWRAGRQRDRLTPPRSQRLPSASSNAALCARIVERFQLGESLTDADRAFLETECRR
jgi:hypothetical protein